MNNPYFIGLEVFSTFIGNAFKFHSDLFKIGMSTMNATPLTTWNKRIIEDVIEESLPWLSILNRVPSIK